MSGSKASPFALLMRRWRKEQRGDTGGDVGTTRQHAEDDVSFEAPCDEPPLPERLLETIKCVVCLSSSTRRHFLQLVLAFALPMLSFVKDKHPWNLVATTVWSVLWGVFMAAAQLPSGLIASNTLFVIMGSASLGVFCLLFCSQVICAPPT